jgi:hypothetical protein
VDEASFHPTPVRVREDEDEPFRPYLAGALGGFLPVIWGNGGAGAQLSVRGGAIIQKVVQIQLEVSPVTTLIAGTSSSAFSMFEAVASIGYLIPMSDMVSWNLRVGGGGGALLALDTVRSFGPSGSSAAFGYGEFRAEVVGVTIRPNKHLVLDFNVPSFRLMFLPGIGSSFGVMVAWVTNVGVGYIF